MTMEEFIRIANEEMDRAERRPNRMSKEDMKDWEERMEIQARLCKTTKPKRS